MRGCRRWPAAFLICLLHLSAGRAGRERHSEEQQDGSRRTRQRGATQEADEDVVFAAEMLGLVYDRVRDVGDLLRVIGDTTGGLAGGSIKLLGASVNGLASGLDAVSRGLKANVRPESKRPPTPLLTPSTAAGEAAATKNRDAVRGQEDGRLSLAAPHTPDKIRSADTASDRKDEKRDGSGGFDRNRGGGSGSGGGGSGGGVGGGRGDSDPIDRIGSVVLTSLAGSLKIISTAVGGVGDAVFQAGMVAEGLGAGTGRVAEDTVRLVQRFVGWARDDIVKLDNRKNHGHDSRKGPDVMRSRERSASATTERPVDDDTEAGASPSPAALPASLTFLEVCKAVRNLGHYAVEAAAREVVALFRRKNGALPPAPRMAVFMMLVLFVFRTRRRNPAPREVRTPRRTSAPAQHLPERNETNRGSPSTAVAVAAAAGLYSPSRSLFSGPQQALGSPIRTRYDTLPPDSLDPPLPSPAQARAAQARTGQARDARAPGLHGHRGSEREFEAEGETSVPEAARGRYGVGTARTHGRWRWWRMRGYREPRRVGGDGSRRPRYILWLVLLWLVASVLEERERDRLAWLAWDEGFRQGQVSRAIDPAVEAESAAWLNHIVSSAWGGTKGTALSGRRDGASGTTRGRISGCSSTGILASDGLSSFVAEHLTEGLLAALEEMKATSVVGVELLDVKLGSSAPRVLGIKMLDPSSSASPGWGDGLCSREGECVSLRVDLEVATQDLRVGVKVKASSLEKALLPTGTVRLLELYLRGSVSVRAELRDEFPFVSKVFIAFDDPPDVQVNVEPWGLDEWARIALQQALAPYVSPGFIEVDAAHAMCPDCPTTEEFASHTLEQQRKNSDTRLAFRLPARASAAVANVPSIAPIGEMVGGTTGTQTSLGKERPRRLGKKAGSSSSSSSNNEWKRGSPSSQDSKPLLSRAGAASGFEGDEGGERQGARNNKRGLVGGQETTGCAATMANLHEYGGEKGGSLHWLKDRLSNTIAWNNRIDDGRGVMDWEGMD